MPDPVSRHLKAVFKKAISQLITITAASGALLYLKCPYQAKVMKILETSNKATVAVIDPHRKSLI
jgi:hypothetical protein